MLLVLNLTSTIGAKLANWAALTSLANFTSYSSVWLSISYSNLIETRVIEGLLPTPYSLSCVANSFGFPSVNTQALLIVD